MIADAWVLILLAYLFYLQMQSVLDLKATELLSNSLPKCHNEAGKSKSLFKNKKQVTYLGTTGILVVKKR